MDTTIYDFQIRVLIDRDGDAYVAHALEMDIVAYAKTEKAAMSELRNLVFNQMSFAIEKGKDHLMVFPAPKEYFDRWEAANTAALKGIATDKSVKVRVKAVSICFTEQDVRKLARSHPFELTPELARA
jgi:hypothetical protein